MRRFAIDSSLIREYYVDGSILEIVFHNGDTYRYDVPLGVLRGFLEAGSKGKYYNAHIKGQPEYKGQKMHPADTLKNQAHQWALGELANVEAALEDLEKALDTSGYDAMVEKVRQWRLDILKMEEALTVQKKVHAPQWRVYVWDAKDQRWKHRGTYENALQARAAVEKLDDDLQAVENRHGVELLLRVMVAQPNTSTGIASLPGHITDDEMKKLKAQGCMVEWHRA